eukprot:TRINITY_DN10343_c1_g2_i1.p4 TRINITY_DN10343_c1_g2~~TRINITY_DN10343_c1_g2_i1.p4  ORF type:complete len:101 (-),score=4.73 TRINITY_DN10343_c1_g2_i1:891-1193(-)
MRNLLQLIQTRKTFLSCRIYISKFLIQIQGFDLMFNQMKRNLISQKGQQRGIFNGSIIFEFLFEKLVAFFQNKVLFPVLNPTDLFTKNILQFSPWSGFLS